MSSIDMVEAVADKAHGSMPKIIFASAAGTMVEWYDFYIFGSLASVIASKFYKTGTPIGDVMSNSKVRNFRSSANSRMVRMGTTSKTTRAML